MDAKILALIKTDKNRRLMPSEVAIINAYVSAGKTPDLINAGTELGNNAIGYHKSKTKLSDHGEYLGAVKSGFDHLSKESLIDNEKKWPRWLEATFHVYDKVQKNYFTRLANQHIKLMRDETPKQKINYKTLALDLARSVLCGDRDGAEKLAQQIAQANGDTTKKEENSSFSIQPSPAPPKPKKTHVFGSQNHEEDGTDTITGLCGQILFDPAITFSRDADPKNVTCSVCKLLLKKQQKRLKENGLTPEPGPGPSKKPNTNLIYEPGGITEFARLALNREVGCVHDCKYCYGPASMHVKREDWTKPRAKDNYLTNLLFDLRKREKRGLPKHQVLMEYSGDCYGNPADTLTSESIKLLHDFGYGVCILTKAGSNAVKDIKLFDPKIDCFGSTITTFDPVELAEWEPKAPCPQDRLAALKEFHDAGVYTWISMEPIISPATSLQVIELTHQCVDHYKTGLMSVRGMKLPNGYANHDWKAYAADFIKACESYGKTWYAKHTLEPYLPAGAVNEKFRPMCHPDTTQEIVDVLTTPCGNNRNSLLKWCEDVDRLAAEYKLKAAAECKPEAAAD
jgi:DNA repair photolyase